jgi:hypothetical protein
MSAVNSDRVERVISAKQWRVLRALLRDGSRPADPILREREILDYKEHLTVCYELHHVLLPELSDAGFVEFDRFEDEVRRGTKFNEVRRFLEQIDNDHDA